ncbi:MAG: SUMF1/EgtB/PvdO family nonheme iron enzyme [Armatimonadota bacterium]
MRSMCVHMGGMLPALLLLAATAVGQAMPDPGARPAASDFEALHLAIADTAESFGPKYPKGQEYLAQLEALERSGDRSAAAGAKLESLRREALLASPLLDFEGLVLLKRKRGQLGLPVNHKCNSGIEKTGYDNEIAVLSPMRPDGALRTLFRPRGSEFVGEMDLHYDADRLLFTMPRGESWRIFEIGADGSGLRQVTPGEHADVDNFDGCYLPDGRIVFSSTASYHAVPCWHGKERACSIYRIDADGSNMRQLTFDQDLDLHPSVLPSGQVIFSRWDYTGPMHMYPRPLVVMNPDGTGQRAVYGSNSYWPNALYFPRGIAGAADKLIAIVAGYHGVPRMGELGLLDLSRGWYEADGVVQRIPGRGKPVTTVIRDILVDDSWPKFLHPYPLSDKYFLVAAQPRARAPWGIYLVDVFDNMVPVHVEPEHDLFEPIPLKKRPRPHVIPDRVRLDRDDGVVYLHDVYAGPGLAGVPRSTVKRLRVVAYHYGYPGMAGPDKVGSGGPWEVMRILGTVPVHEDGSAMFRVPARTPITVQPLDAEGKAVQLMRSWFTAMPGESISCTGCHARPSDVSPSTMAAAMDMGVSDITPWYGPARGFDFEREVQPVLDRYCVTCHNAGSESEKVPDLRSERHVQGYAGRQLSDLGAKRLHPGVQARLGGAKVTYTPAYEALAPYIRRVGIEDDVRLLAPGEYHADTSELIQMLKRGHHNVALDDEAWDRLVTWIDLNGPCHGTWGEVAPIPEGADRRRRELALLYRGATDDPEVMPELTRPRVQPVTPEPSPAAEGERVECAGWPFDPDEARRRQGATRLSEKTIDLGGGVTMRLAPIPAGQFVMGDADGEADERPLARVAIEKPFWMGTCEVTNEQFQRFDPGHRSGFFMKRYPGKDGPGLSLGGRGRPQGARQPALRVSWQQAAAFCRWLSRRTGMAFTLPTEAQWEYACRAGSGTPLSYGAADADFSGYGNVADKALSVPPGDTGGLTSNITAHRGEGVFLSAIAGGDIPCDARFDDGTVATAAVGRYAPNAWGLYDMHGNAAEWTLSTYMPYPYREDDGRNGDGAEGRKVVRGGSFRDRPKRCRSAFRLSYPAWQRVHNVGFRVVCEAQTAGSRVAKAVESGSSEQ